MGRVQGVHIALFLGGFVLTGLGITIGYHRLATHRSFETNPLVKAVLYILGSAAVEGPVVEWVANHMKHHINADREGDPHSPRDGLLHSHWGWLTQFAEIEAEKYASWTLRDPVARAVSATFIIWVALGYVVPFLIAGWEGFLWGGLFRQCAVQNVTFAVNSVCHRWGAQPFNTNDLSRNNWIVGILGLGEGWHNNHHAFPVSAYHGLRWWEFDLSGIVIRVLEAVGLVKNVRRPALGQIQRKLYVPAAVNLYERVAS
ncbi:MAG: acyl-CoA desaturase [Chloroflexi bacterium]|nr:acyl-CoA desaturase [Chloroflexota bacterium]